jgi:hypothetical protein
MRQILAIAALLIGLVVVAHAQIWIMTPSGGGGTSPTGAGGHGGGGGGCSGAIDLSIGCALPMLHGAP